jgi:hypothetical protein
MRFKIPRHLVLTTFLACTILGADSNPFLGHWDFDVQTPNGIGANWLGVSDKDGKLEVWFQPTGGHVHPVEDVKLNGSHLTLVVTPATGSHPATTWDLDASGNKLTGTQKTGDKMMDLNGVRAPELKYAAVKRWSKPEPLFDGKDLKGWEPIGDPSKSHWVVKDGDLVNEQHGANLKSTREFENFKLHFEVNCPDKANSGMYLRGRYEVQLEYEPEGTEPMNRQMGAIYGRIAPAMEMPRMVGQWESFDVTLIGRMVTIVRDGKTIIDNKEIEGITGGAMNADEGKPGPFYIQGDHTGGLKFRNITVSVPKS